MVKEQARDWECYWQSDASPSPVITVEKTTTHKGAEAWLAQQKPAEHATPHIRQKAPIVATVKTEAEEDCNCFK